MCLAPAVAAADIYRYVDDDGNVVFTDEPREGAERIESAEPESSYQFHRPQSRPTQPADDDDGDDEAAYTDVRIVQPEDEGTVRDNQGYVEVAVSVDPQLQPGHAVQFVLDGEPQGSPDRSLTRRLADVHRGEHQVRARILDRDGNSVAESDSVTFYMHQASRLLPGGAQGSQPGGGAQNPGGISFPGN